MVDAYLDGLPEAERSRLAAVNAPGLARLGEYLKSGEAVAFVGPARRCRCIRCGASLWASSSTRRRAA